MTSVYSETAEGILNLNNHIGENAVTMPLGHEIQYNLQNYFYF